MKNVILILVSSISVLSFVKFNGSHEQKIHEEIKSKNSSYAPSNAKYAFELDDICPKDNVIINVSSTNNEEIDISSYPSNAQIKYANDYGDSIDYCFQTISNNATIDFMVSDGDNIQNSKLYLVTHENLSFTSLSSFEDAEFKKLDYLLQNEIIGEEEYDANVSALFASTYVDQFTSFTQESYFGQNQVTIELSWIDDDAEKHPLRFSKVELWDQDNFLNSDDLLASGFTDVNGKLVFYYNNTDQNLGCDIYFKVFAAGVNTKVTNNYSREYKTKSNVIQDVVNGQGWNYNACFNMSGELGQAMQISQAAIYAAKYAKILNEGEDIRAVTIKYPVSSSVVADYNNNVIQIPPTDTTDGKQPTINSFADWDTIGHEFGHHVASVFGFDDSMGGYHEFKKKQSDYFKIEKNFSDAKARSEGVKFAWSEGFATYYGVQFQQVFSEIQNIKTVGGSWFCVSGGVGIDLNNDSLYTFSGEADEHAVAYLLYNLVDSANDYTDNITVSDSALFNLIASCKIIRIGDLIDKLYFWEIDQRSLGNLLSSTMISAHALQINFEKECSENVPATFAWATGGSQYFPNDKFAITFTDYRGRVIVYKDNLYANEYVPSKAEWEIILNSEGSIYDVNVAAMTTTGIETGPYISGWQSFTKPSIYKRATHLRPTDYDIEAQYFFVEKEAVITGNDGLNFTSKRLRTGYIEKEYIVLSPMRENAGEAYIEYDFIEKNVEKIEMDIAYWSNNEGFLQEAKIQYKNETNEWETLLDLLTEYSVTKDRKNPNHLVLNFENRIQELRIITSVSNPSGSSNKGRLCIGDMFVYQGRCDLNYAVSQNQYGFEAQYFFEERKKIITVGNLSFETKRKRVGYIENEYIVLSPRRSGAGEAYIEYKFARNIKSISFEMSLWSANEGVINTAAFEYKDQHGEWKNSLNLLLGSLGTNRKEPNEIKRILELRQTSEIRIIATADAIGSSNSGRICIGNMIVVLMGD